MSSSDPRTSNEPSLPLKADVYHHLPRKRKGRADCVSVRSRETDTYGRVQFHGERVTMRNVEFVIQPGEQERAREEGKRTVHALARGVVVPQLDTYRDADGTEITYNPFKYDSFVTRATETPVAAASAAIVTAAGVEAHDITPK